MNHWDTRPTFGLNHETRETMKVENGFTFNGESFTVTDNHHTPFDQKSINIGTEKTFWLKIIVGDGGKSPTTTPGTSSESSSGNTTSITASCEVSENSGFVSQIQSLINNERKKNGLPTMTINALLTNAARNHAADMACNSTLSHTGSDGSYVNTRIADTGYSASYSEEIIYAGGGPQDAFDWWMNDKPHRDAILSTRSTEMGIGYAYLDSSTYGGYFTVAFASP